MRLNFLCVLIAIGFSDLTVAQQIPAPPPMPVNDSSTYRHFPYYSNKKNLWGYADSTGRILIKPAFHQVKGFYKGFAGAKAQSGWGIINEKGKWVVQPENDMVECREFIDVFVMQKKDQWIVKYIVDGQLSDQEPSDDGNDLSVTFDPNGGSSEDDNYEPANEIRRFTNQVTGQWQLGEYLVRKGKPDSLISSRITAGYTIAEPIKTCDEWNFSLTRSPDKKKVGLICWHSHKWVVRDVEPAYDSIWAYVHSNPTFYGRKDGKVALINFDTYGYDFHESPAQFDEVKNWSTGYYVVRIDNAWYRVKNFGFFAHKTHSISKVIDPELIIRDVDDILPYDDVSYYLYRKNGLLGVIFNRNAVNASTQKDEWFIIPAQFTSVKRMDYWFEHGAIELKFYLFDVTLKNGRKGPMTVGGTLLFK